MDVDKSEDELELERLVFGDSEGIKERLRGKEGPEKTLPATDLEHLEDDQVGPSTFRTYDSYSSLIRGSRVLKWKEPKRMKKKIHSIQGQHGTIATTKH